MYFLLSDAHILSKYVERKYFLKYYGKCIIYMGNMVNGKNKEAAV